MMNGKVKAGIAGLLVALSLYAHRALYDSFQGDFTRVTPTESRSRLSALGRFMVGPLAAIPDPLEDNQRNEIESYLSHLSTSSLNTNDTLHPVLFVPGLLSSQMETQLTDRTKPHWWLPSCLCPSTTSTYEPVWFIRHAFWNLLPFVVDCYVETLVLRWNVDNTSIPQAQEMPGIDTRPIQTFNAVMELDPKSPTYKYYADWLTQYFGYKPDQQMIAQPFDWRVGPETWITREFEQMKTSIERVVQQNKGRGVVALSISAGGPFFALFLNQHVDQAWKDKHIHAFFSISGAFSGSVIAPMQYLSLQHNSFMPDAIPAYIRDGYSKMLRSTSSVSWLFPHKDSYHSTIISTPQKDYAANELDAALTDAGYSGQAKLYLANRPYYGGTNLVPGVRTFCLTGFGIPSLSGLHYTTNDMSDSPTFDFDDGDNCLTVESLRQCDAWAQHQKAPVHVHHFYNHSHAGLLYNPDVIKKFFDVVAGKEEE